MQDSCSTRLSSVAIGPDKMNQGRPAAKFLAFKCYLSEAGETLTYALTKQRRSTELKELNVCISSRKDTW